MARVLLSLGYEVPQTNVLLGQVDSAAMRDTIYDFFSDVKNKPTDTLLFYYSGHGVPDVHQDVFMATSDIDPAVPSKRCFNFNDLTNLIRTCTSTSVVAILDCCYSGSAQISKGRAEDAAQIGHSIIERQSDEVVIRGEGKCIRSAKR